MPRRATLSLLAFFRVYFVYICTLFGAMGSHPVILCMSFPSRDGLLSLFLCQRNALPYLWHGHMNSQDITFRIIRDMPHLQRTYHIPMIPVIFHMFWSRICLRAAMIVLDERSS